MLISPFGVNDLQSVFKVIDRAQKIFLDDLSEKLCVDIQLNAVRQKNLV